MSPIHLRTAPITEAIIDIQGVPSPKSSPEQLLGLLKSAHKELAATYPTVVERVERQVQMSANAQPIVNASLMGYLFQSNGSPQKIMQFRKNGYAFSWLSPYGDWLQLVDAAKVGWEVYRRTVPEFSINRVAVRFINQFKVPYPLTAATEYLREIPNPLTSPGEYSTIKGFAEQMVTTDSPSGTTVSVTRLIQEPASDASETQVVLDLDVFRQVAIEPKDNQQIWQMLPAFREVKNRVFFKYIGPATIRDCGGEERP
jgi:uncharacterized protein (TIGR04255 family)